MELTRTEKIMKTAALLYAIAFIFTAVVCFIALPDLLIGGINEVSGALFPSLPAYPVGENRFWLAMTVSMMAGVTVTSLMLYRDVRKNLSMAVPLTAMKFTSSLLGLGFFLWGCAFPETKWNALANLVIFTTDFPLGLFMLVLYRRIKSGK